MRTLLALVLVFAAIAAPAPAGDVYDSARAALTSLASTDAPRSLAGGNLNQALVALTGEAINPLVGVTAIGIYNYIRTDPALRDSLPAHDRPVVWVPLLVIIGLMLFNSTIANFIPILKVPLNALGDLVNKAGAVVVLPFVVTIFANTLAPAVSHLFAAAGDVIMPAAHAGEPVTGAALYGLGWLFGVVAGVVIYAAVWLTFNVVDVLVLICPFPFIDTLFKTGRLGVLGLLAAAQHVFPPLALVIALLIILASLLVAGWSFRLSVFGWTFSTDILFLRHCSRTDAPVVAFAGPALAAARGLPLRTRGRLERSADGVLAFSYRRLLILPRRSLVLGRPGDFACGRAWLNPSLVGTDGRATWLRLPPRYRGCEDGLTDALGLAPVVDCGVTRSLGKWLRAQFTFRRPDSTTAETT